MLLTYWRSLVGTVPAAYQPLEYAIVSIAVLLVISLFFRLLISLVKILYTTLTK